MAGATLELCRLPAGARFRTRQHPEGELRGTVDLPAESPGGLVEVAIDGDGEGTSSWPGDAVVLMTGPAREVERLTEGCTTAYRKGS